jgi:methyl-accepting chemotaxis protein
MNLRTTGRRIWGHFAARLVAGMLVVSLPIMILLAVVLTQKASTSLSAETRAGNETVARTVTLRLEDWLSERQENVAVIASRVSGQLGAGSTTALVTTIDKTYRDFTVIEVTDLAGRVTNSSRPSEQFDPTADDWFRTVTSGKPVLNPVIKQQGKLRWIVAAPVLDVAGQPEGAVIADLNAAALVSVLGSELRANQQLTLVDAQHLLIYASSMGKVADDAALLQKGALSTKVDDGAVTQALAGHAGSVADFVDIDGNEVSGGYDNVEGLGWALVITKPYSVVVGPIHSQRNLAVIVVLIGAVLTIGFSVWFARRATRPIEALSNAAQEVAGGNLDARAEVAGASELQQLGEAFNTMVESLGVLVTRTGTASQEVNTSATELSASSEELAATTTEQSAAVTEVSATTEELARASASIADTVDEVAAQAAETRDNLAEAEADIQASSERTLALAERVNEIGAILTLINDIADQTNLLALNAAIEAARAGDAGRGFAVVADEVRQLAERSKASASDIAAITEGVHTETNASVMAMEKGAKQMQRGLVLLEEVTQATEQVRLTTQQQRSATGQVVETMEQLAQVSRQVSGTAQQIAEASASLADLARNLEQTSAGATKG